MCPGTVSLNRILQSFHSCWSLQPSSHPPATLYKPKSDCQTFVVMPNKPFSCKPIDAQIKHTPETMRLGTVLRLVVLCCNASVNIRVSPWRCAFVSVPPPWAANAPIRFQCTFW